MKRITSFMLALVLIFSAFTSGTVTTFAVSNGNNALDYLAKERKALIKAGAIEYEDSQFYLGVFYFILNKDKTVTITQCDKSAKGTVIVPSKIGGLKVNFGLNESRYYSVFSNCNKIKKIIVSEGINYVGTGAFSDCASVKEIVLPKSIKAIGDQAFRGCTSLKKVNIPDAVTEIGYGAFADSGIANNKKNWKKGALYWDSCLISVKETVVDKFKVRKGTKKIGSGAFEWSQINEIVLPESLTTISGGVGLYCNHIEKINIPKNVNYIGESFFYSTGIGQINVAKDNPYFCVINQSLLTKDKKRLIRCFFSDSEEDYRIPKGIKKIDSNAFNSVSCDELIIPKTTKTLSSCAFARATINKITLPKNIKEAGWNLFSLANIHTVNVNWSVKAIPYGMFIDCYSLEKVTISAGVEEIEGRAFTNCSNLKEITLPSTLKEIETSLYIENGSIFEYCNSLKKIKISSKNKNFTVYNGILYNKAKTELIYCPNAYAETTVKLPSTVGRIAVAAFSGCKNITTIKLPKGIEHIPECCFFDCENLKKINIPNTVKVIDSMSFAGCNKLNVVIPNSVKIMGDCGLGYDYDEKDGYKKIKSYKVKGYKGSVAQDYAKENGFNFVSKGKVSKNYNKNFVCKVSDQLKWLPCKSAMKSKTIFLFGKITGKDVEKLYYFSYGFLKDYVGQSILNNQVVGTGAKLSITSKDDWNFTDYVFVRFGDANGDGLVNKKDIKIAKKNVGKKVADDNYSALALDFNGDKKITKTDVKNLEKLVAGKTTEEKVCHVYKKSTKNKKGQTYKCSVCGKTKKV